MINQENDTVDPINEKNFEEINDIINSTKSKFYPIKETIDGKGFVPKISWLGYHPRSQGHPI